MKIESLLERMQCAKDAPALVCGEEEISYLSLRSAYLAYLDLLEEEAVPPGSVVALEGDFRPATVGLLLALLARGDVAVPLTSQRAAERAHRLALAQVGVFVQPMDARTLEVQRTGLKARHPLLSSLRASGEPGLVLFTSGSTGQPKVVLHNAARLLARYERPRPAWRTLAFLLFDHIGGLNTLFHTLANGGTLVVCEERTPDAVCALIERHRVELLPTSPTFLNLLVLSEAHRRHDLTSLQRITYGTEPMPEATLRRLREILPRAELAQTYGLSELGILRAKSKTPDSLLMRIGGEGYETKVVDSLLWIRAESAMLGYLNAPSPFDGEGWFNTGDLVAVEGEYLRVLGRHSEIINVGGEKVHPVEVESVNSHEAQCDFNRSVSRSENL
jgi:acyl-CoA synthetase (AMP-forming)/AMP-acid ligase II